MNEYITVELNNKNKCVIIDAIEYQNKKYCLVTRVSSDETSVSNEFDILIYNEFENYFDEVEDSSEYALIKSVFERKLEMKAVEMKKLDAIDLKNMIQVKVIDMDEYSYVLEDKMGKKTTKNLSFYGKIKPQIGDYIYMTEKVLKEVNTFQYGSIYNLDKINEHEIIKLVSESEEYFFQRYYG